MKERPATERFSSVPDDVSAQKGGSPLLCPRIERIRERFP